MTVEIEDLQPFGNGFLAKGIIPITYENQLILRNWYAVAERQLDNSLRWSVFRQQSPGKDPTGDNIHFTRDHALNREIKEFIRSEIEHFLNENKACSLLAA